MSFATAGRAARDAKATATDRRVAVATTDAGRDRRAGGTGRETADAGRGREIARRRVKTRAQRLNYSTADH